MFSARAKRLQLILAGLVVIAGASAFVFELEPDSVRSIHIVRGQVRSSDIGQGQVRSDELAPIEPTHIVGNLGEPSYADGGERDCLWLRVDVDPAGFYKDPFGLVHLEGTAFNVGGEGGDGQCNFGQQSLDGVIFILPPGYRPDGIETFPARRVLGNEAAIFVNGENPTPLAPGLPDLPPGAVYATDHREPGASIGGIIFRAAG
jgi:hypothetical protein